MIQLGILLTAQHRLLSVAALLDVFESVNKFYEQDNNAPFFKISTLTAISGTTPIGDYVAEPISADKKYGLILVPAFSCDDLKTAIRNNHSCINWLHRQYAGGAEVASFCTGAFLLAASGLLDQKAATTHINATGEFSAAFPLVNLKPEAVVTEEQGIYTSGGATSTFHLLLRIIENHCGREMAVRIAKYFAIDMDREHQTYFGTFQPRQVHQDELVTKVQQRIKKNYAQVNTIEEIVNDIPASRRNLVRRFKMATGNTPIEYLQKTRIEAAKKCLEQASGGVLEAMISSGYNDQKAFRQLFKKTVGMTPSAYRNKYLPYSFQQ